MRRCLMVFAGVLAQAAVVIAQAIDNEGRLVLPRTDANLRGSTIFPGLYIESDPDTGITGRNSLNELLIVTAGELGAEERREWVFNRSGLQLPGVTDTFLLASAQNGTIAYCLNCTATSPCAGSGTGAFAFRNQGAWNCSGGSAGATWIQDSVAVNRITPGTGTAPNAPMGIVLYNEWVDSNNYSNILLTPNGNSTLLAHSKGTGTPKDIEIVGDLNIIDATPALTLRTADVSKTFYRERWFLTGEGNLQANDDQFGYRKITNVGGVESSSYNGHAGGGMSTTGMSMAGGGGDPGIFFKIATNTRMSIEDEGPILPSSNLATIPSSAANGTMRYCNDCAPASSPCTASSTGAIAFRIAGAWKCF